MKKSNFLTVMIMLLAVFLPASSAVSVIAETTTKAPLTELKINGSFQDVEAEVPTQDQYEVSFKVTEKSQFSLAKTPNMEVKILAPKASAASAAEAEATMGSDTVSQPDTSHFEEEADAYFFDMKKDDLVKILIHKKNNQFQEIEIKGQLVDDAGNLIDQTSFGTILFKLKTPAVLEGTKTSDNQTVENTTAEVSETPKTTEATEATSTSIEESVSSSGKENTGESTQASGKDQTDTGADGNETKKVSEESVSDKGKARRDLAKEIVGSNMENNTSDPEVISELTFAKKIVAPGGENQLSLDIGKTPGSSSNILMSVLQLPHDATGNQGQLPQTWYSMATADGAARSGVEVYVSDRDFSVGPSQFYTDYLNAVTAFNELPDDQRQPENFIPPAGWLKWEANTPLGINPKTMIISYFFAGGAVENEPQMNLQLPVADTAIPGWHFESRGVVFSFPNGSYQVAETDIPETSFAIEGFTLGGRVYFDTSKTTEMSGKALANQSIQLFKKQADNSWQPVLENTQAKAPKVAKTDSQGHYQFSGLAAGTYRVGTTLGDLVTIVGVPIEEAREDTSNKISGEIDKLAVTNEISFLSEDLTEENLETPQVNYQQMNLKLFKKSGSVTLSLIDANSQAFISGGKFQLMTAAGQKVIDVFGNAVSELVTKKEPITSIDLPFGNYKLVQLEAPANYELAKQDFPFSISEGAENKKLGVANYQQSLLPNTGNNGTTVQQIFALALLSMLISLGLIFYKRYKFQGFTWFMLLLSIGALLLLSPQISLAQEEISQNDFSMVTTEQAEQLRLSIHKYGYFGTTGEIVTKNMTEAQIQKLLTEDPQLKPLTGFRYRIVQVRATSTTPMDPKNLNTFELVAGGFQTTITTDQAGTASVSYSNGLVPGNYQISELPNNQGLIPMPTKITAIPRTDVLGENLIFDVHMYPKEKLMEPPTTETSTTDVPPSTSQSEVPPTPNPPTTGNGNKVPKTGIITQILKKLPKMNDRQKKSIMFAGAGILVFTWWLIVMKRRKKSENEE